MEPWASLQDVKLRAAFCLCHVLRMHAPDHPYELKIVEVCACQSSVAELQAWMTFINEAACSHGQAAVQAVLDDAQGFMKALDEQPHSNLTDDSCALQLQAVLGLFLQVFRRLDNPLSPSFQLCLSVLDIVSQVRVNPCKMCSHLLQDPFMACRFPRHVWELLP